MTEMVPARTAPPDVALVATSRAALLRELLWLAMPVLVEHLLHMIVGLTDTYLANHLPAESAAATAAVGTIAYVLWFIGMIIGAVGAGSTAIIARAVGAKHRRLANSVCGQSVTAAILLGLVLGALAFTAADPIVRLTGLEGAAAGYAISYLRLLSFSMPFSTFLFAGNACLRGAGDTRTPAAIMVVVDIVNIVFSFALTYGLLGFPRMGFHGIAAGTVIAFVTGGLMQAVVLIGGWGGIRLYLHRLRPHTHTLYRLFRIGVPSGAEGLLAWLAQFAIVIIINKLDSRESIVAAAHINSIRIESVSFMAGFAFATAAATMVGQSLGMKDPRRAATSAYLAYAIGGGIMIAWGLFFIFFARYPASWMSSDPRIAELSADCLWWAGLAQCGFAASAIFSGALRGAGDTLWVMIINLASVIVLRLGGVLIVAWVFGGGLVAIWAVLAMELLFRGLFAFVRFAHGGWRQMQV